MTDVLRGAMQTLMVGVVCSRFCLLPGVVAGYPGRRRLGSAALGCITQPFRVGVLRSGVTNDGVDLLRSLRT